MLLNLQVKNFALIDECEVDFNNGLNILTGETGAGKSIIIDSINMCLGAKASKDVVRNEAKPAEVALIFSIDNEKTKELLNQMDIPFDDDEILITKKIQNGRGVSKINGETVSANQVKKLAELLIDIHGQHEHQSLLSPKKHLEILDEFGKEKISVLKENVSKLYKECSEVKKELYSISLDEETKKREISFLEFEIKEIENASLVVGEDDTLEKDYKRLSNGRKIIDSLSEVYANTSEGSKGSRSASDSIGEAVRLIAGVSEYDEELGSLAQSIQEIESLLSDFNRGISSYMSDNEFSEEEFEQVSKRLDLVNDLKVKYGKTIEAILDSLEEKKTKLDGLKNSEEQVIKLKTRLNELELQLDDEADKLSKVRKEYAKDLEDKIKEALVDLNFLQVEFEIDFTKVECAANGVDEVCFMISTNPGEAVKELGSVASGGELSRIMLAIKTILATSDEIPTLIFDEIDTGISGRTAQKVSEKLSLVAHTHQVICITHLPQIASMADTHYLIEKSISSDSTISTITSLSYEESVTELGRMLGGAEITEAVLTNAREMKELASKMPWKNK